jgi:arylsulfatase A-like enzyme
MLHRDFDFSTPYAGPLVSGDPILDLWQRLDELTPRDAEFLVSLYDSEVAFTDHHIGLVLDELDAQGRFADAVVVVTADHGEEFMERGWLGHSVTLYQELVRVPLLVKLPGVAPRVVETPVSLLDVAPTLLDFLGIQAPPNLDGRVLDLEGEVLEGPVYSETYNPQIHRPGRAHPISLRAIVSGRWKLVLDGIGGRATLYDLAADPGERAGRPAWGHPRGESLERELRDWARRMSRKRGLGPAPNAEELFTPEQRENLEALGYLAPRESE